MRYSFNTHMGLPTFCHLFYATLGFRDDQIGVLAQALDRSIQRITRFIEREKNFIRDSSHELRTPVTVIKDAVELIR